MEYLRSYLHHAGSVPSVGLVVIFYVLLRSVRDSVWRIALLSLPGTVAHELTRLVVGFLVHAKPHGFSIWPQPRGNTWMLGSVSFRNIGLLNGAFVALAPLLLLPIAWLCLVHVLVPLWIEANGDGGCSPAIWPQPHFSRRYPRSRTSSSAALRFCSMPG
ncbi:MAG: hypothetical protein M3R31_03040 [Pseudomonadota bacterium]|nr:hypothetical protein [Pseudomonadota bacterium]